MIATAITGSQIAHFVDVVENATFTENGLHHEWRGHTADGETVRTDRTIKVVCRLPASATVHILHHDGGIARNILLQKRNNGLGPQAADAAGGTALKNGDGLPLEERSLRKSDTNDEQIKQCAKREKQHRRGFVVSHRPPPVIMRQFKHHVWHSCFPQSACTSS